VNAFPKIDLDKATRLTRAGRLKEALAVLRGALTGRKPAASPTPTPLDLPLMPEALRGLLNRLDGRAAPAAAANFTDHVFSNGAGSRNYKLFIPSGYHGQPLPLVVMLHGCTQSADDFAAGTRTNGLAESETFFVAYPEQAKAANFQKCWNWFNTADQQRDSGEPSIIAGITRQVMQHHAVKPGQVFAAGLSAGGAAAAIMGATYPDIFAAIGVHSGLACGAASNMAGALAAMQRGGTPAAVASGAAHALVPTIVFHGDADTTVNPVNAAQVIAQAKAASALRTQVVEGEAGGLKYTKTVQDDERGRPVLEQWMIHGAGHAWSGGCAKGSFADPHGPDASREMLRFFLQQLR